MCGGLRVEVRRATPRGAENILYGFYIHLWATRRGAEGYVKKCGGLRLEVRRATPRSAEGYGKKCGGLRLEVRRGVWGVKIDPNQKFFFLGSRPLKGDLLREKKIGVDCPFK